MGIDSFFGIGGPEFFFILILAGIFLGPGRIAKVARWLGQTTAKLQLISRGFMTQLKDELDMADGQEDLRDMLKEMQDLRSEVTNLQNQIGTTLKEATADTEASLTELKNSIAPPTFDPETDEQGDAPESAESAPSSGVEDNDYLAAENSIRPPSLENGQNGSNGNLNGNPPKKKASLPKPIQVDGDPD